MAADDLRRAEELLDRALALPAPERGAWLERELSGEPELAREVASLLAAHESAEGWFERLADDLARGAPEEVEVAARRALRVGPWRTVRLLGRGGMGTVFLAERADGAYEQRAALKLVALGTESEAALARFRAERQIVARLEHEGIARLVDGGVTEDGRPYLVLEHVDGRPIDRFADQERLPVEARLRLFLEVCDAVAYAHAHLVVHRDLKPSNLLVTADGKPKLLDFGIAKPLDVDAAMTRTTERLGTPLYAAPEQLAGGPVTTAADVYALGVVLHELLAGRRPFEPGDAGGDALEHRIREQEPAPASVALDLGGDPEARAAARASSAERLRRRLRGDLDTIVATALAKEPARRYRSVEALADDVRRHLDGLPIEARAPTVGYRAAKFAARHRAGVAAAAVALVGAVAFVALLAAASRRAERERDRAERVVRFLESIFTVADPSEARGASVTAREILDRGRERLLAGLEDDPALRARLLETVGTVYKGLGLYSRAEPLVEEVLARRRAEAAERPGALVDALDLAGELARLQGELARAEELLGEAERLESAARAPSAERLARVRVHLGRALSAAGKLDEAERRLAAAAAVAPDATTAMRLTAADAQSSYAALLAAQGDLAGAEARMRTALAAYREAGGDDHPGVASATNDLATILARQGNLAAAAAVQADAVALQERLFGAEHPRVGTSLGNLGAMRMGLADDPGAEEAMRRALAIRRRALGDDHPETAQSLANLGLLLQLAGRFAESRAALAEALAIRTRAFGEKHVAVAQTIHNLGLLDQAEGKLASAGERLERSRALLAELLPAKHPLAAIAIHNLGALAHERGETVRAEALYREALELRRALAPGGHPDVAYSLVGLGRLLVDTGRAAEATPLLDEAVARRARSLPAGHPELAEARIEAGRARLALGERAAAAELLAAGAAALETLPAPRFDTARLLAKANAALGAARG
jgi:serine/threonine-protein kinase